MKSEDKDENREGNGEMFVRLLLIGGRSFWIFEVVVWREELKFWFWLFLFELEYSYIFDWIEGEGESDDEDINLFIVVNL